MKYKVGDRVRIKSLDWYNENKDDDGIVELSTRVFIPEMVEHCGTVVTIKDVFEDIDDNVVYYMEEIVWDWTNEMIEGLVEDKALKQYEVPTGSIKIWDLPNGYIFKDENGNTINAQKIVLEKKKKEYPKTYEECCKVIDYALEGETIIGYKASLLRSLQKLLICRDAYWKIAGEEMGLGKPWKPDFDNEHEYKYGLFRLRNIIYKDATCINPTLLIFPTEEMRDAFYENFKEEIEICKELL